MTAWDHYTAIERAWRAYRISAKGMRAKAYKAYQDRVHDLLRWEAEHA